MSDDDRITFADIMLRPANDNRRPWRLRVLFAIVAVVTVAGLMLAL